MIVGQSQEFSKGAERDVGWEAGSGELLRRWEAF